MQEARHGMVGWVPRCFRFDTGMDARAPVRICSCDRASAAPPMARPTNSKGAGSRDGVCRRQQRQAGPKLMLQEPMCWAFPGGRACT